MMSKRRLIALGALIVGLASTWFRTTPPPPDWRPILTYEPIEMARHAAGAMTVEGAWVLDSPNGHFGSYSALIDPGDGLLLAASDSGRILRFGKPGQPPRIPEFRRISGDSFTRKVLVDAEAMTIDKGTGRLWIAYEGTNVVERRNLALGEAKKVKPKALARFGSNSGPEAMARLDDGRFIVLSEGPRDTFGNVHTGIVFDRDPVEGGEGERFAYSAPQGFRPVDMAALPDGRVLILLRKLVLGLPPGFETKLAIADPTGLATDSEWSGEVVANISDPALKENFEGLAVEEAEGGALLLWLISDDNNASLQKTKLLKLRWEPEEAGTNEKARGSTARPSQSQNESPPEGGSLTIRQPYRLPWPASSARASP